MSHSASPSIAAGKTSKESNPVVLIVEDRDRSFRSLSRLISPQDFETVWTTDERRAIELLAHQPDRNWIVLIEPNSCAMGAGGFLHRVRRIAPDAAVLVAGPLGPFVYRGGSFYEFRGPTLRREINTVLSQIRQCPGPQKTGSRRNRFRQPGGLKSCLEGIIGQSRAITEITALISGLGDVCATVLITGESGTGKELIARGIHDAGPRGDQPFVAINCAAIPAPLIESELFGYERGAFTGAYARKKGKFEIAGAGTLFLDEIGDLDKDLQVKLLRVLQEKEFQRVGGNVTIRTNVRIVAATSQNLKMKVRGGQFRDDLFYRLNVIPIHIPPLRERREDIEPLLEHFFLKAADALNRPGPTLSLDARDALIRYSYPGNARELGNICERLLITSAGDPIRTSDLPEEVLDELEHAYDPPESLGPIPREGITLKELERELIVKTLQKTKGNKAEAAKMLGITRRLLYLRLSQYALH